MSTEQSHRPPPGAGQVAIVGVGNMGGGMAERLLRCGWTVAVHDLDPHKPPPLVALGARLAADAADAAAGAAVLIVAVVTAEQTREVLFGPGGAASALAPGAAVLLCPTISPEDVEALATTLKHHGLCPIDAPMSGGPQRAREGTMSLMLAAPKALLTAHQTLLDSLSSRLFVVGERPGDGARTKLVNNLLAGINLVGAAEAMALAQRVGLDPAHTLDVIEQSSGQSWIGSDRMRRALGGDLDPRAHMTLLEKDTRLAVEMARSVGFDGPVGPSASAVFAQASAAGRAEQDDGALFQHLGGHVRPD